MSRENTIAKYAPQFLKGKSEDYIKSFYAKDLGKQYSCIMNWRRKLRQQERSKQKPEEPKEPTVKDILNAIRAIPVSIDALPALTTDEIDLIDLEFNRLQDHLVGVRRKRRQMEIATLKRQQEEISMRLKQLMSEPEVVSEPEEERNLFSD